MNKNNGNVMKLLSEEEEDVHLDEGMQAEENVFSVDYDVWVDEETGDTQIEKYPGHLTAYQCNSCGFKTMKLVKEELVIQPTDDTDGEMIKNYRCTYCKAKRSKTVKVARLSQTESHYELPAHLHFKEEEKVNMVSLEIHISNGKSQLYEFSSTKQARIHSFALPSPARWPGPSSKMWPRGGSPTSRTAKGGWSAGIRLPRLSW